jgi:hypothetical protein
LLLANRVVAMLAGAQRFQEYQMNPTPNGSDHPAVASTMVFSHPAAGEAAARATDRAGADDAARDVVFSTTDRNRRK